MKLAIVLLAMVAIRFAHSSKQLIDNILLDYDATESPRDQTNVEVGLYINYLGIKDTDVAVVDMYYRQRWQDRRLAHSALGNGHRFHPSLRDRIWLPDTFFRNARTAENKFVPSPQFFLSINGTGHVWFVQTIKAEFTLLQNRVLPIMVESYSHTADEMSLSWMSDPVESVGELVDTAVFTDCSQNYTSGTYGCLSVVFNLE